MPECATDTTPDDHETSYNQASNDKAPYSFTDTILSCWSLQDGQVLSRLPEREVPTGAQAEPLQDVPVRQVPADERQDVLSEVPAAVLRGHVDDALPGRVLPGNVLATDGAAPTRLRAMRCWPDWLQVPEVQRGGAVVAGREGRL